MIDYRMSDRAVVISRIYGDDIVLDEPNLRQAIENIRERRDDYATTAAWSAHLTVYEGALAFLTAHAHLDT